MIRVVFTQAPGFVSGVIRALTGSKASHCGIQLGDDAFIAADAQTSDNTDGVRVRTRACFLQGGRKIICAREFLPAVETWIDKSKILSYVGDSYDMDALAWDLIPTLSWRWFKIRVGNPFADRKEFICSGFVATALRKASSHPLPELQKITDATVTPGQLMSAFSKGPSTVPVAIT